MPATSHNIGASRGGRACEAFSLAANPDSRHPSVVERRESRAERDQQLVRAANDGDRSAFEALYRENKDSVLAIALRLTPDRADAEDAVAEAFQYLLRRIPPLQLVGRLTTLLYPVVKHAVMGAVRKRRTHEGEDSLASVPAPIDSSVGTDEDDLRAALAILPEAQREVLLLRSVDELSVDEVSEALEIPPGTVKSRLFHALAALRADERTRGFFEE